MNEKKIGNWKRELIFIASLILLFLFGAMISSLNATTITRISDLGEWYLHSENDTALSQYRQWSINLPDNQTNITLKIDRTGEYQIGQWISPYILSTSTTIQFDKFHNWMSKIWAKGEKATMFFKLYTYNNGKEELIFTSCPSYELGNATDFKRQRWQCRDDYPHIINQNERLVIKLFINASSANNYTIGIDGAKTPSSITDPTEDRYFDWNSWTVNTLTAKKHITTYSSTQQYTKLIQSEGLYTMYSSMRAWLLHSDGTTTEIGTSGTYKAICSGFPTINKYMISGTWTYPTTAMVSTDAIKVNVYNRLSSSSFSESDLAYTFVTEQLGASSLDTATVSLYQNIAYTSPNYGHLFWYGWYYLYGEYFENGGVSGWAWTPAPPAYSPNPSLDVGDPFYCSIPPFIPSAQSIPIFCMPKNNQTGQPLTGLTITCKAWTSPIFGAQAQAASSATELGNGLYNWTFQINNQAANTCYIINCSSVISTITNWFAGLTCVSQSFVTSCASTAEINAVGTNLTIFNQSTNNTLSSMASNISQLTIMQQSANTNISIFNQSTNGSITHIIDLVNSLANLTDTQVWAVAARTLTDYNQTLMFSDLDSLDALIRSLSNMSASDLWVNGINRTTNCTNCEVNITVNNTTNNYTYEYTNSTNSTINNSFYQTYNLSPEVQQQLARGIARVLPTYEEQYNAFMHPVLFGYTLPLPYLEIAILAVFFIICSASGVYVGFKLTKKWGIGSRFK